MKLKMNKEQLIQMIKINAVCGTICFIIGGSLMSDSDGIARLQASVRTLNQEIENRDSTIEEKDSKIKELEAKVEEAKPWFDQKEEERKAEEARLAEEKAKQEAEEKARAEEAARLAEEQKKAEAEAKKQAEAQKYETGLTYEDIARNPEQNKFEYVKFEGKIVQVIRSPYVNQYRMAINGDYNKIVLFEIVDETTLSGNILENDYVCIKGKFLKEQTYTTIFGAQVTLPFILVDDVSFQ